MTSTQDNKTDPPSWSLAGLSLGAQLVLPVLPGIVAFAIAVGTMAARKGFSLFDTMLMNVLVYAGASQMVAMDVWPDRLTFAAVVALALLTATVNARMLLMGASLRPWLGPLPAWQVYPMLHLTTDPGWLIAMRYRAEGGSDAGVFLGGALAIVAMWLAATVAGYWLGVVISNPRALGIDLIMPIFFAMMLIPLWRGVAKRWRRGIAWLVAGGVALAVERILPGWWFIVVGALVGAAAEAFAE